MASSCFSFRGTFMMAINPDESLAPMQMPDHHDGNTLQDLLAETRQYLAPEELERIERAYELASRAHQGVLRRSGEPYIQHPLEVALLLADMRIDADSIVAALLHDVVEDTDFTLDELRQQFGDAVANIVDGVTKFDTLAGNAIGPSDEIGAKEVNRSQVYPLSQSVNSTVL